MRYTHIQACGPGGIAEADGGFAKRFHDFAEQRAKINPEGILNFPSDFIKGDWRPGQIITAGGEDFQLTFDIEESVNPTEVEVNTPEINPEDTKPETNSTQKPTKFKFFIPFCAIFLVIALISGFVAFSIISNKSESTKI